MVSTQSGKTFHSDYGHMRWFKDPRVSVILRNHPFSQHPLTSEAIFLTDGLRTVRYRHLPSIFDHAHSRLASFFSSQDSRGSTGTLGQTGTALEFIAIDTTDRFEAVLWMACCWVKALPFILFNPDHSESLESFAVKTVIYTSNANESAINQGETEGSIKPELLYRDPEGLFCGLLTSGSSDRPKKVVLNRGNMISAAFNAFRDELERCHPGLGQPHGHLWGNCLPLHHTGGMSIIFRALLCGTGIYLWNRFDQEKLLRDLKQQGSIRRISLVPTMLKRLVEFAADQGSAPPSSLRNVLVGGGPADPGLIIKARTLSWPVTMSYGMTETCGQIAVQKQDGSSPPGSSGIPFPDHEVTVRDEGEREARSGETGLLWLKGPQVFPGYLPDELPDDLPDDLTVNRSKDTPDDVRSPGLLIPGCNRLGWFETGDYARIDEDGNLFIESRRTDLIISGGENVNPVKIEAVLHNCSGVADVAVAGADDVEWGQKVIAYIVPDMVPEGCEDITDPEFAEMLAHLENQLKRESALLLKPQERPKEIRFTSTIPRTALGKLRRDVIREWITGRPSEI